MSEFGIGVTLKQYADNFRTIMSLYNKSDVSLNVS